MRPRRWPGVPGQTAVVARAAFPKGALAMRVRDELGEVFADERFGGLFGVRGRPGISPGALAMVTVLQFAENLSDRQAADAVRGRIDWKYCLGLELGDPGFDFSVLCEFRGRLAAGGAEQLVLDVLLEKLAAAGLVRAGGVARTDSTHVLAAVRSLNRLERVLETLRAALEALAAAAPGWLAPRVSAEQVRRYAGRAENARLPRGEAERAALAAQAGADGYALLEQVHVPGAPPWLREIPAVQALRQVWVQQFYRQGGGAQFPFFAQGGGPQPRKGVIWRDAAIYGLPPGRLELISPYDTAARYSQKRGRGWEGYKVHLTETCDPGRPHLITAVATTSATVADVAMTAPVHAQLAARGLLPHEHLADAGYTSTELLISSARDWGVTLTGPLLHGRPGRGREGRYGPDAFTIDWDAQQVTCPQGITTTSWSPSPAHGPGAAAVRFPAAACQACPARDQCTTSRTGRQLILQRRELHQALRAARARQQTPAWKNAYARRAGIEATIGQATAVTGIRRTRYTGLPKVTLEHALAATAINLLRLDAWQAGKRPEPTRTSHLARLGLNLAA